MTCGRTRAKPGGEKRKTPEAIVLPGEPGGEAAASRPVPEHATDAHPRAACSTPPVAATTWYAPPRAVAADEVRTPADAASESLQTDTGSDVEGAERAPADVPKP